jgi:hypothetical protein
MVKIFTTGGLAKKGVAFIKSSGGGHCDPHALAMPAVGCLGVFRRRGQRSSSPSPSSTITMPPVVP